MFKKINHYKLFVEFLNWAVENGWLSEEGENYLLTNEGMEEMTALGMDIEAVLNGKIEEKTDDLEKICEEVNNHKREIEKIHIYTDGGARGNQNGGGPAAIGIVICDDHDEVVTTHKQYLGKFTNNQTEYTGLITALSLAKNYHAKEITCFSDSQLMINQLNGIYRIKDAKLQKLVIKVKELEKDFELVQYVHVPRENKFIRKADKMLNRVLNSQEKKEK